MADVQVANRIWPPHGNGIRKWLFSGEMYAALVPNRMPPISVSFSSGNTHTHTHSKCNMCVKVRWSSDARDAAIGLHLGPDPVDRATSSDRSEVRHPIKVCLSILISDFSLLSQSNKPDALPMKSDYGAAWIKPNSSRLLNQLWHPPWGCILNFKYGTKLRT